MATILQDSGNDITYLGDRKWSNQTADHGGWVLLNGRLINTLLGFQQTLAASLGFSGSIPDLRDRFPVGSSPTKLLNSIGGSPLLLQTDLPSVSLTASSYTHNHGVGNGANPSVVAAGQFGLIQKSAVGSVQTTSGGTTLDAGGSGSEPNLVTPSIGLINDVHSHTVPLNPAGQTNYFPQYASANWFIWLA